MSFDDEEIDNNFDVVVADGARSIFLDGFVSLLFYQKRHFPKDKDGNTEFVTKKQTIADIRLSLNAIRQLVTDLQTSFKYYPFIGLGTAVEKQPFQFFSDSENMDGKPTDETKIKDEDAVLAGILQDALKKLSHDGKIEYLKTVEKMLLANYDVFRDLIKRDLERQEAVKKK